MPGPSSALRAPPAANTAPLPTASSSGQAAAPTPSAHSSTSMNASSSTSSTAALKDGAARPAPPPTKRLSLPRRLLNSYLQQLSKRPLRTKMITSTVLFCIGDSIAQFGIEGRRLPWMSPAMEEDEVPPSSSRPTGSELKTADKDSEWDPVRAARLMFYGGTIFAPLAHNWLNLLQRVQLSSKLKTVSTRIFLDQVLWGPFIVCLFWTSNGILEGKSLSEVRDKLQMAFWPVYKRSICVFGPTAAFSFWFVPLQHRLLVGQSVGLGWNTYLSYLNHVNNKRLAGAAAAVSAAQVREVADVVTHADSTKSHAAVEHGQEALEKARLRKEKILASQGGGSTGVGTRMGH